MNITPFAVSILSSMFLVACGSDVADENLPAGTSTERATQAAPPQVRFTVTGDTEVTVEGLISIHCSSDAATSEYIEVEYVTSRTNLSLKLQPDVMGSVALIGRHDDGAYSGKANIVHFRSEALVNYNKGAGHLLITSMPAAAGEKFIATMTADLLDKNGGAINIAATYDAVAGYQSFDDCQSE